ncbi:hypothetical protein B0H13DRAFT_2271150 [Mycena leptocephala]|nr:hypothetical protein B0H13DRAFT_2271150 [Mycena leptocephala]
MLHHWSWVKFYSHGWTFASPILTGIMAWLLIDLYVGSANAKDSVLAPYIQASTIIAIVPRSTQAVFAIYCQRGSFFPALYIILFWFYFVFGFGSTLIFTALWTHSWRKMSRTVRVLSVFCIVTNDILCLLDWCYRRNLIRCRAGIAFTTWLEDYLLYDSIPVADPLPEKVSTFWSQLGAIFRWLRPHLIQVPPRPSTLPTQVQEGVLHWSHLIGNSSTRKALWITADIRQSDGITDGLSAFQFLSAAEPTLTISVDDRHKALLFDPLEEIWNQSHTNFDSDPESQQCTEKPRVRVVIHGICSSHQAHQLYNIMKCCHNTSLDVVAISSPQILREVSTDEWDIMEYMHTLSVSETGIIYSGYSQILPRFNQNLFRLVLEGIYRSPDEASARLWAELFDRADSSVSEIPSPEDLSLSITTTFHLLHEVAEYRKLLLKFLLDLPSITQSRITIASTEDDVDITVILQRLVQNKSYKHEIPTIPKDEAFSVLNLTHKILDRGSPENTKIEDKKLFRRQAHRLLNILADFVKILPEELSVHGVVLQNDRPVKYGGFADIYHGKYTTSDGEEVEVALKVLRIFRNRSDDGRHLLLQKFAKEALVWQYLKHPNIVRFLGVDATTFLAPTMAMVSSWMSQGNVLNYMEENSPVSRYAIALLDDIIQGLTYLHSQNIVHGDLCGRNILINGRQAYLTDFGLAAFVELDTSIKTSTRKGSTRWMAPELLLPDVYHPGLPFRQTPASDVWAFGCVCCEIWTEGQIPFVDMSDGGIIFALSGAVADAVPYKAKPCDKAGIPMPERLWELANCCFKLDGAERTAVNVIADILSEMKRGKSMGTDARSDFDAGRSGSALPERLRSSGRTFSGPPDEIKSQPIVSGSGKGQQRVHLADEHTIIRFGPLHLDGADIERLFDGILEGLFKLVRRDVLIVPVGVDKHNSQYLHLQFRSPVEANNFAMTWMVYRYDPHKEVSAVLVDN